MFVQLEALAKAVDRDVDYQAMGLPLPEDILSFEPIWVNLSQVIQFYSADPHQGETILDLSNGKSLQINMSEDNFLILLDQVGLLPAINEVPKLKYATNGITY